MKLVLHPAAATRLDGVVASPGGTVLLHGTPGVGKRTAALEVARRLNCNSCSDGSCKSCRMVLGGNHPDVIVVVPDEKNKIGMEQVHELQHKLHYEQYATASQRVVVIAGADRLTLPAQSALLKTLEEPPAGTTILLTSLGPTALLTTVVSRCRLLYLPPVPDELIRAFIAATYPLVDAETISSLSHGSPGRAVVYATTPDQLATDQVIIQEVDSLLQTAGLFERLQAAAHMAAATSQRERYGAELIAQARVKARTVSNPVLLEALERLQRRLRANVNPKTAFEALAVELG